MRLHRCLAAAGAVCVLAASACSSTPTRTSVPAPAEWTPEIERNPVLEPAAPTAPPVELVAPPEPIPNDENGAASAADESSGTDADGTGLIAAAGPTGLRLLQPSGEVVGELGSGYVVTQPTWSRDGRRLVATLVNPTIGTSEVAVVDITTGNIVTAATARPYFFYTWSHDGSRMVALGPGQNGGTAAVILDETGTPASDVSLLSPSLYVAWEPAGQRLLVHAGHRLMLVNDVDSPQDNHDLGTVGVDFLAPAWVPGTQEFLYVDSYGQAPVDATEQELLDRRDSNARQLLRRNADTDEITDLGPTGPYTTMAVHPTGDRAAVSAAHRLPATTDNGEAQNPSSQPVATTETPIPEGSVQIVDLATAERRTVLDRIALWLEWSPDGQHLLIAADTDDPDGTGLSWHIWDGQQSYELARFSPTATFLRDYLQFADQYDETPRLWSPAGDAITFGANTADGDITAVARLDRAGDVTSLGASNVSFWSPVGVALPQEARRAGA